ncbi:IQ and ubiquitin-like domain-containing protein [Arapaima gigas]
MSQEEDEGKTPDVLQDKSEEDPEADQSVEKGDKEPPLQDAAEVEGPPRSPAGTPDLRVAPSVDTTATENEGKIPNNSGEENARNPETDESVEKKDEEPPEQDIGDAAGPRHSPTETFEERVISTEQSFTSVMSQEENEGKTPDVLGEENTDNLELDNYMEKKDEEPPVQGATDVEGPPHSYVEICQETVAPTVDTTATVKVALLPDGHMVTKAFSTVLPIQELKNHFAKELKIPSDAIEVLLDGSTVPDHETLIDLGVPPHGSVQMELRSRDPKTYPIRPKKPLTEYSTHDVITVRVQKDPKSEAYQQVVVEIERSMQKKAFLGGYQHKITGMEFQHAAVQTLPRLRPDRGVKTFCRCTQTVETKSQSQQLANTTSTQMTKIGCYVSNMEDKVITPGVYITADEYHSRRLKAVIVLQTYVRQWQAKCLTDRLRKDKERRMAWVKKEELRKKQEKEEFIKADYHRRMNPKTKEDFDLLYNAVDKWRQEELERINATLSGPERKAALCALLEQETQFIAYIGQHRLAAGEENQLRSLHAFLEKCAAPKRWRAFDGKVTLMDTQHTIRARELKDLYNSITRQNLSQDERLQILLSVKNTIKEHDCKLKRDIVELIDREVDLLSRRVREANLGGLRMRIATLFLQYIKTPAFNPEAARLLKVPQDPVKLKRNIFFCLGCGSYLQAIDFPLTSNSQTLSKCKHCRWLDNAARVRDDLSLYKEILCRLQHMETEYSKKARIPFLLQKCDMRYLVDVIWEGQSALSSWNDLHDLVMVRWDRCHEWSPWNCILLTQDEAPAHLKLENVEQAYSKPFMSSIKHKHTLAKKYFSQIPDMAEILSQAGSQQVA